MKSRLTLFFAILCSMQMMATSLVVQTSDGAQQLHDIALIGKWVFVGEELQLIDKSGLVIVAVYLNSIYMC